MHGKPGSGSATKRIIDRKADVIFWMRSSRVVRASDSQCLSRNCPGFDPSFLQHSGI
jgi:hypothetical protein